MAARILVVAGLGTGAGTGGAVAQKFGSLGYKVALIARGADRLKAFTEELKSKGVTAAAFPVQSYKQPEIESAFAAIKKEWSDASVRVTVWNAAGGAFKRFYDVTPEDLQSTSEVNVEGAFAFARQSLDIFKKLEPDEQGARGTLIFTNATAGIRGNVFTSAFAAGKHALRALSQSLAKEFGVQNIHVVNVIVDGGIKTERREEPKDPDSLLLPEAIADTYAFLAHQHSSAWTWELDLRPAHEKW